MHKLKLLPGSMTWNVLEYQPLLSTQQKYLFHGNMTYKGLILSISQTEQPDSDGATAYSRDHGSLYSGEKEKKLSEPTTLDLDESRSDTIGCFFQHIMFGLSHRKTCFRSPLYHHTSSNSRTLPASMDEDAKYHGSPTTKYVQHDFREKVPASSTLPSFESTSESCLPTSSSSTSLS
jgi:hypothetical protein